MSSTGLGYKMAPESAVERNKAAVWDFFDEVFNKGNTARSSVMGTEYRFNGKAQNNDAFIKWVQALRTTYPDMHVVFLNSLGEGDVVAVRWQMTGTHAGGAGPDGWTVTAVGINILKFDKAGHILTNDESGACTRTQNGASVTHDSNNIFDLLLAPALPPTAPGG